MERDDRVASNIILVFIGAFVASALLASALDALRIWP